MKTKTSAARPRSPGSLEEEEDKKLYFYSSHCGGIWCHYSTLTTQISTQDSRRKSHSGLSAIPTTCVLILLSFFFFNCGSPLHPNWLESRWVPSGVQIASCFFFFFSVTLLHLVTPGGWKASKRVSLFFWDLRIKKKDWFIDKTELWHHSAHSDRMSIQWR